jgi:hypothetical protein
MSLSQSFDSRDSDESPQRSGGTFGKGVKTRMMAGLQKLKQTVTLTGGSPGRPPRPRPQSEEGSQDSSERLAPKKKVDVVTAPRAIDGGPKYEMLSVDTTETEDEHTQKEPLPYRFTMPPGFKQLMDPQTTLGTNTFVYGQDSQEYLDLRGRMTVVDTTMSKIRQQMEWLHQELMVLETEKQDLTLKLHNLPLQDRSCTEFSISVHPQRAVEALPVADEEQQDLMRRAETTAISELPHGGEYVVLHSGEHVCTSSDSARMSDPAEWRAWEMHCQTGPRHVAAIVLRRKYLPDTGVRFQDLHLTMSALSSSSSIDLGSYSPSSHDSLQKLRSIAHSLVHRARSLKWCFPLTQL